ncbi:MAG: hypothetical protein WEF51_05320 [Chloroflexota bacterium]
MLPALGALAAALAVTVGVSVVMSPGPFISPARQSTAPSSPPPLVDGFPTEVLGLPVISVSEAIALRDAGPEGTEIAIRGYEPVPESFPRSCPVDLRPPNPLQRRCGDRSTWLTERPEATWEATGSGFRAFPPSGPALQPLYRLEVPVAPADGSALDRTQPLPVVVVGHFNDHRSVLCADVKACRLEFVVDARTWVAGHEAGREVVRILDRWNDNEEQAEILEPQLTAEQASAIASGADGAPIALPWVAALTSGYLEYVDPRAAEVPQLAAADIVWVVRVITSDGGLPFARTMFVVDDSGASYRSQAAGILRSSEVTDDHQPSEIHVRLDDATGREDVTVGVFDFSGTVVAAASGAVGSVGRTEYANGLFLENAGPDLVRISWIGSRCDREHVLTINRDGTRLLLARPAVMCVAIPVERTMLLRFKAPVDAASLAALSRLVPRPGPPIVP